MAGGKRPRRGSLQVYPRKRIDKFLPSVNWSAIKTNSKGILGFIGYKVAMATAVIKDNTDKSMTLNKKIFMPATILEVPNMKVFSVRFYKNGIVSKEVIVSNDPHLKRIVKVPKTLKVFDSEVPKEFDDIRIIAYSLPSSAGIRKTPDIIEIGFNVEKKLDYVKTLIAREITLADFLNDKVNLVDARGLTTGKGFQGPMKRFGVGRRSHKAEKGVRKVGSIGPWHPAHITFRVPVAGQLGNFTRVTYNLNVLKSGKAADTQINPVAGFRHYGNITSSYIVLKGSVQGPSGRQILLTAAQRPTKKTSKRKFEFQGLAQ